MPLYSRSSFTLASQFEAPFSKPLDAPSAQPASQVSKRHESPMSEMPCARSMPLPIHAVVKRRLRHEKFRHERFRQFNMPTIYEDWSSDEEEDQASPAQAVESRSAGNPSLVRAKSPASLEEAPLFDYENPSLVRAESPASLENAPLFDYENPSPVRGKSPASLEDAPVFDDENSFPVDEESGGPLENAPLFDDENSFPVGEESGASLEGASWLSTSTLAPDQLPDNDWETHFVAGKSVMRALNRALFLFFPEEMEKRTQATFGRQLFGNPFIERLKTDLFEQWPRKTSRPADSPVGSIRFRMCELLESIFTLRASLHYWNTYAGSTKGKRAFLRKFAPESMDSFSAVAECQSERAKDVNEFKKLEAQWSQHFARGERREEQEGPWNCDLGLEREWVERDYCVW